DTATPELPPATPPASRDSSPRPVPAGNAARWDSSYSAEQHAQRMSQESRSWPWHSIAGPAASLFDARQTERGWPRRSDALAPPVGGASSRISRGTAVQPSPSPPRSP